MYRAIMTILAAASLAFGAAAQQEDPAVAAERDKAKRAADVAAYDRAVAEQLRAGKAAGQQQEGMVERMQARRQAALAEQKAAEAREAEVRWLAEAQARATRTETLPFCGVSTSTTPAVLTEQLKLAKGMGLV